MNHNHVRKVISKNVVSVLAAADTKNLAVAVDTAAAAEEAAAVDTAVAVTEAAEAAVTTEIINKISSDNSKPSL